MKNMLRVTHVEAASIALSIIAIGVSAWAVVESRRVSFESRRSTVRDEFVEGLVKTSNLYSYAQCSFSVSGRKELEETLLPEFDESRQKHRKLVAGADTLRHADDDFVSKYQSVNEERLAMGEEMRHELMRLRLTMSQEELERLAAVCGDEP